MNRRTFLHHGGVAAVAALTAPWLSAVAQAADESALIYLSPFKSNGALSQCQAEVWYVQDDADMCVVTANNAWRARAVRQGLSKTQVWVGDVGQWQSSDGRYKSLPAMNAQASIEGDPIEHARLLQKFGAKYDREWSSWGPRFKKGLADGSRVLLRYQPA